jgi:ABC-type multidrug transport system fused ATPase/permease subunit
VMSRLRSTRRGKTTVLIAHRMSAARHSDRMVVLHDGAIVASGTFDELAGAHTSPGQPVRPEAVVAPT